MDGSEKKWKIRDPKENKIFGPATMEMLKTWAQDGRLAPGQELSCDDRNWFAVESLPDLEMDWVVSLPDRVFYGPVNREAMKELIRSGELSEECPQFVRMKPGEDSPVLMRQENAELKKQLELLRQDFTARAAKLEADLAEADSRRRLAESELSTRDLDFDAERQQFSAELSRMEAERQALAAEKLKLRAEIAKAEKRAEVLAGQLADSEVRNRSREADNARISELEKLLREAENEVKMLKSSLENQSADARRALKKAEVAFFAEKESYEARLRETKFLADKVKSMQAREDALRRAINQAYSIIGSAEEIVDDAIIVDPQP